MPPEDPDRYVLTELKGNTGAITAISMDDKNEEGMVGTSDGKIFYVSLKENKEK